MRRFEAGALEKARSAAIEPAGISEEKRRASWQDSIGNTMLHIYVFSPKLVIE